MFVPNVPTFYPQMPYRKIPFLYMKPYFKKSIISIYGMYPGESGNRKIIGVFHAGKPQIMFPPVEYKKWEQTIKESQHRPILHP